MNDALSTKSDEQKRMELALSDLRDLIQSEGWATGRSPLSPKELAVLSEACAEGDINVTAGEMAYWSPNHNILIVCPSVDLASALNDQDWSPIP